MLKSSGKYIYRTVLYLLKKSTHKWIQAVQTCVVRRSPVPRAGVRLYEIICKISLKIVVVVLHFL